MSVYPNISRKRGFESDSASEASTSLTIPGSDQTQIQGEGNEVLNTSDRLIKRRRLEEFMSKDDEMPAPTQESRNSDYRVAIANQHNSLPAESRVSNSCLTAGRDINMNSNSYYVTNLVQVSNNHEVTRGSTAGNDKVSEGGKGYNHDTSNVVWTAGMSMPSLPPWILEREPQHNGLRANSLGMGGIVKTSIWYVPAVFFGSDRLNWEHNVVSDIANGMLVPSVRDCVLERDKQHDLIVQRLLATSDTRVALLGMGGIGKTTLACRIARDPMIVNAYSRRLFISFEGSSTPELAYTSLATIFQIPAERRTSRSEILSQVVGYLSQTKTLLILDNFETFWEASENRRPANEFLEKLACLSNLAIIVTLRGIQRPESINWLKIDPLETLSESASKELFWSIAQANYDRDEAECVEKLLKEVAGIPLAVTLIGNLLRDGSERPHSLWRRWNQESTRAIGSDVADRQYQLDVSLRLSIFGPRMNDHARELLAAVSLLPSGLNMDDKWLDDLAGGLPSTISIHNCIRTVRNVALSMVDSPGPQSRLRLLSPVREFCQINLDIDSDLARRLIEIYSRHLDRHHHHEEEEHYAWVTRELSNITAIIHHALRIRHITDDLGYLCARYSRWRVFLNMPETEILQSVIEVLGNNLDPKAYCLRALGDTLIDINRFQEAAQHLEQALYIDRTLEQHYQMGWDLYFLGKAHYYLSNYQDAERCLNEANDLFRESGANVQRAQTLVHLAEVYRFQAKFSEAQAIAAEALEISRMAGNRLAEANALGTLGDVYRQQGKFDEALKALKAGCDLSREIKDVLGEANSTRSIGYLYRGQGEVDQAASHFRSAIALYEQAQYLADAKELRDELGKL